jgi:glycosyltransferase involved in cell wall biosynthesis
MPTAERICFVTLRYAGEGVVGGAETMIRDQALHAQRAGRKVSLLTTCATNHFTWENEIEPGTREIDGIEVTFFPTDPRDVTAFLNAQRLVEKQVDRTEEDELTWLSQGVSSEALYAHLREHGEQYDRILIGPYLFGLTYFASQLFPDRTILIPCLHDESFAYMSVMRKMFRSVRTCMFNTTPEQALAQKLYDVDPESSVVVGMGLEVGDYDPVAFTEKHPEIPEYIIYSGRREGLKGTPLLIAYFQAFRERTERDLHLVLCGKGEVGVDPTMKPYVHDLGYVTEREKHEAMAGAVAFVHPSRLESFGIVLLEAWLTGTPALVHSDCAVTRQHCADANAGLWWQTYPEFETQLCVMLDRPEMRDSMGKSGREYVQSRYTWDIISQRLLEAIDR